ncbi:hypothetical protein ABT336_16290 [Micromonospora sp. NPDC000207]|uniref:hypothetical protein n=1 Tax=Micromonospora sp. NPDC000207 TaxID=3154246 RepID=UPI00331D3445
MTTPEQPTTNLVAAIRSNQRMTDSFLNVWEELRSENSFENTNKYALQANESMSKLGSDIDQAIQKTDKNSQNWESLVEAKGHLSTAKKYQESVVNHLNNDASDEQVKAAQKKASEAMDQVFRHLPGGVSHTVVRDFAAQPVPTSQQSVTTTPDANAYVGGPSQTAVQDRTTRQAPRGPGR